MFTTTAKRPFAWSFSALDAFQTCPRRYYQTKVAKNFKEVEGEALVRGKQVHDAFAARLTTGKPFPEIMSGYEKWAEYALRNNDDGVKMLVEQKMAITEAFKPCEFFDRVKPVWLRTVLDVLKVRPDRGVGRIIDWKTGKFPNTPDKQAKAEQQLDLFAAVAFYHYPEVDMIMGELVYVDVTNDQNKAEKSYSRGDLPRLWQTLLPRVEQLRHALDANEFPPNPGGLCKNYCPVSNCPHHGVGSR